MFPRCMHSLSLTTGWTFPALHNINSQQWKKSGDSPNNQEKPRGGTILRNFLGDTSMPEPHMPHHETDAN